MLGLKILAVTPFGLTAIITTLANAGGRPDYLQYGALGLCAIVVIFLCGFIKQLIDKLDRKDKVMGELYQKNTEAYNRLANLLSDRPCLQKDHRIQG